MTHPTYVREKAIALRRDRALSIDEIAERLALPKTTIYYWVRDIPLARPRRENPHPGTLGMQEKYRRLREAAYAEGRETFALLAEDPSFRDFICLYIAEGYKCNRNCVAICNSDPVVMMLAHAWLGRLTSAPLRYGVQYHADQDVQELQRFWGATLGVSPSDVRLQRKSNSGQLAGRQWRSRYGVLAVRVSDTYLRARLQAWIDCLTEDWLERSSVAEAAASLPRNGV